jgi:hypothetical protein
MTQAPTRKTYRLVLLTNDGEIGTAKGDSGPDCLTATAAKATTIKNHRGGGQKRVVAEIDWRLGGDGVWRETGAIIAEVL